MLYLREGQIDYPASSVDDAITSLVETELAEVQVKLESICKVCKPAADWAATWRAATLNLTRQLNDAIQQFTDVTTPLRDQSEQPRLKAGARVKLTCDLTSYHPSLTSGVVGTQLDDYAPMGDRFVTIAFPQKTLPILRKSLEAIS